MPPSNPPPSPKRPGGKPAFHGVARTPYSKVQRDGDCLVVGFGALLPPICVVTGEPVDPKAFPALTYEFVVKEPTYMEKRLMKQTPEKESFRYFVNEKLRRQMLSWQKIERYCLVGFGVTVFAAAIANAAHVDRIIIVGLGVLFLGFMALGLFVKSKQNKTIHMDKAKLSPTQVWISGLPSQVMEQLCSYNLDTK